MKKETKSNMRSDVAASLSSAVGATIGMIIGNAVSAEVNAREVPVSPISGPTPLKPEPPKPEPIKPEPVKPEPPKPEPPKPEPPQREPEIEVVTYETVNNEDGSQMDVAIVSVDGQRVAFIDGNMDGIADVYVMDANGNGTLEENEFIPLEEHNLSMAPLREAVDMGDSLLAQNDDYVNDADVDDFMA